MDIHTMKRLGIFCLLGALVPCTAVRADDTNMQQRRGGGHRKPPQEAYDACKGKSEGTSVEVSTPRGTMKAVCKSLKVPVDTVGALVQSLQKAEKIESSVDPDTNDPSPGV